MLKSEQLSRRLSVLLAGYAAVPADTEVTSIENDSRRVRPGALFLACRGHSGHHGLTYLPQAIAQGAAAVAWEPAPGVSPPQAPVPAIAVERLSAQAGEIAARFYGHPSARLFSAGITGTDGKTSTAYLIAQTLERMNEACVYLGTLGYGRYGEVQAGSHTTPDAVTLQRLLAEAVDGGVRAVAMEISSHALDQARVSGMNFDVAVLTNVGRDHLDYHGTLDNYAAAKRKLFYWPALKATVLNRDDARGREWAESLAGQRTVTLYGLEGPIPAGHRYVLGRNLQLHADGLRLDIDSSWGKTNLQSQLLGRFNAYNLLAALAVLLEKGLALDAACQALAQANTVPGRIEGFRGPKAKPLVVVDYAHTPQALAQILQAVRAHTQGKLWCVFGCGGDRDRGKRPLMGAAAAQFADRVIVTDDNPRSEAPAAIVAEIRQGMPAGDAVRVIHERDKAIRTAVQEAVAGDVVVVAGKGHEEYQIYGKDVKPFSDRAFVAGLVGQESTQ